MDEDRTRKLLRDWHDGDAGALDRLLEENLDWLREHVRRRMGGRLREMMETVDVVQDVAIDALRYSPRFVVADQRQFRALLGKMIENNLRDKRRWSQAERRAAAKEVAIPSDTVLELGPGEREVTRPDVQAARDDLREWMRLALEFLDESDRRLVRLREFEGQSFQAIGAQLDVEPNTVRMRFRRALAKLAQHVEALRGGQLDSLFL